MAFWKVGSCNKLTCRVGWSFLMTVLVCVSAIGGCGTLQTSMQSEKSTPLFRLAPKRFRLPAKMGQEERVTISAEGLPLGLFARQMAELSGVSIVVEEALEERLVSLEVVDQTIGDVLAMVARRLSTQTTRTGNLYFLGQLRTEDRGVFVTKVGHVDPVELQGVAELLLSTDGRAHVSADGVCVVGDKVEVLTRIAEAMELIRGIERDVWLLQLHILSFDTSESEKLGISAGLRGAATASAGRALSSGAFVTLDAALEAANAGSRSSVVAQPLYLLNEGQAVKYHRGSKIPVRESIAGDRTVSQSYKYVDVGLRIDLAIAGLSLDDAVLTVGIANERVTSYEDDAPVIDGTEFATEIDVQSGGEYLVTSYDEVIETSEWWQWLGFGRGKARRTTVSQVWLRAYRVRHASTAGGPNQPEVIAELAERSVSEHVNPHDVGVPAVGSNVVEGQTRLMPEPLPTDVPEPLPTDAPEPLPTDAPELSHLRSQSLGAFWA